VLKKQRLITLAMAQPGMLRNYGSKTLVGIDQFIE